MLIAGYLTRRRQPHATPRLQVGFATVALTTAIAQQTASALCTVHAQICVTTMTIAPMASVPHKQATASKSIVPLMKTASMAQPA